MNSHSSTFVSSIRTDIIQKIASFFQLGTIVSSKKIHQGMNNPTYLACNIIGQEFVIRILDKQTLDGVKNEYVIQQQLKTNNITCPIMLQGKNGKYYYNNETIKATVSKKIEGYHPNKVNKVMCFRMGMMLAHFHLAAENIQLPTSHKGWLNIESANKNLSYILKDNRHNRIITIINDTKDLLTKPIPSGIIHGDFIIENILFNSNNTIKAILDFDESEENIFLLDIAKAITGACVSHGQIDKQFVSSLLKGYNTIRTITKEENQNLIKALSYVIGVCAAWFIKNGYEESANRYLNFDLS